jgi:hypothetical protein
MKNTNKNDLSDFRKTLEGTYQDLKNKVIDIKTARALTRLANSVLNVQLEIIERKLFAKEKRKQNRITNYNNEIN